MAISHYMEGDLSLNIARGIVLNASAEHKFGAVPAMSTGETGTIWDINDTPYPWTAFDTAGVLTIPPVNVADNGGTVTVFGLDANYEPQTESFVVSNTLTTTGTKTFKRVHRAYYTDGITNVGAIDIQRGGTTVARISVGKAQTLMAVYTVPYGYTAYLSTGTMSIEKGGDASGNFFVRYFGQSSFRIAHSFEVGDGSQYKYNFAVPLALPAKTDIDVRCTMKTNNSRASAAFDMILIKD